MAALIATCTDIGKPKDKGLKIGTESGEIEWEAPQKGEAPVYVQEDTTVYCSTCNKYFMVKKGQQVPLCCGRTMESLD